MQSTTENGGFPADELRRVLQRLVRVGLVLEPHEHAGIRVAFSEVMALGDLAEGAMSQQELAARLGLEKSTVSRLAAGLEERGWLARERDPANRRFYRLRLTDEGRDAADRIGADLRERHARMLGALSAEERDALLLGLTALARVLDAHEHEHH